MNMHPAEREDRVDAIAEIVKADLPADLMMTSTQVVALQRAGMEIGGHTITHPVLAAIPIEEASREITGGRHQLEQITGDAVRLFAYPRGRPKRDYTSTHVSLVREFGFDAAVSTAWGVCQPDADLFQIPRFTPWDVPSWKFGLRLAMNLRRGTYEVA
jgi:peptidoglycan/xylan/chitin deacetylase (PgdA/CDA1 family)